MAPIIPNQDSFWQDVTHAAAPHPSCVTLYILPDKHLTVLRIHYLQFASPPAMWTVLSEATIRAGLSKAAGCTVYLKEKPAGRVTTREMAKLKPCTVCLFGHNKHCK